MLQAKIYDTDTSYHVLLVDGDRLQEQIYSGTSLPHAEMAAQARADVSRHVDHWVLAHSNSIITDDTPTPPSI